MCTIIIKNLLIQAAHGVMEQERRVGNTFRINLSVSVPEASKAGISDHLEHTINYAEMVEIIRQSMSQPRALLEAAGEDIIRKLKETYGERISNGTLSIEKLAPPIPAEMESVGVIIDF